MVSHISHNRPPGPPDFYRLDDALARSAFRGDTQSLSDYRLMESASLGEAIPQRPLVITQQMGRRPMDFMWVSVLPIVHERVVDLLTRSGATGWSTYPVEVFARGGELLPGYHGFAVTGRCGSMFLDREHSAVVYVENPRGRFPHYQGLFITLQTWDGADIFTAADGKSRWIVVSRLVRDLIRKHKVTNVLVGPISEVRVLASNQPVYLNPPTG